MLVRDIHPFGVRMPKALKERLDREAKINDRSLNSEIVNRLTGSFENKGNARSGYVVRQEGAEEYPRLSDIERQMLNIFRRMPVERQLAMLSLFK